MSHNFSRRNFLKASLYGLGAATIGMSLTGCNSDDDNKLAENEFAVSFNHGVASGDPLSDAIILWTRVTPAGSPQGVNVTLQIADDENFESNRVQQTVVALASNDYTVKREITRKPCKINGKPWFSSSPKENLKITL